MDQDAGAALISAIEAARRRHGLTHEQLADKLGIETSTWYATLRYTHTRDKSARHIAAPVANAALAAFPELLPDWQQFMAGSVRETVTELLTATTTPKEAAS